MLKMEQKKEPATIRIKKETRKKLANLRNNPRETYDQIINKTLDKWEQEHGK